MLWIAFIIISVVSLTNGEKCNRVRIGEDLYRRLLVATIDGSATNLVVDDQTDNVLFILNKKNYTKGVHLLKYGSLGAVELVVSDDLVGQCVAIDKTGNKIIGTNQGILTYDYAKTVITAERPIGDDDVRKIFIDSENSMYIITGPNNDVYKFINHSAAVQRFEKVPKAYNFVVNSKGDVFYEYTDGRLYFLATDLFEPIAYKGFSNDLKYILSLKADETIVAVKNSLFKLTTKCVMPVKIADLGFKITGLAFDNKNNIYVGTKGKVYKFILVQANEPCNDDYFMSTI